MNCDKAAALLAADADGEVDGLRSHALRKHVAGCAACAARRDDVLELQRRLRAELPRHAAPAALRERLRAEYAAVVAAVHADAGAAATAAAPVPPQPQRQPNPAAADRRPWRWFGGGALSGALAAGLVWIATSLLMPPRLVGPAEDVSATVVGLHTQATLGHHLIDVASSDRHTVKPWLSARLDYSIPVVDGSPAGFPLLGARIDSLDSRPVATLVYRRRDHVIDVFVRPAAAAGRPSAVLPTVRGFNVVAAQGAEMEWLAVSDLQRSELAAFVQGLARGDLVRTSE